MDFFEAPAPFSIAADPLVCRRMEVSMPALLVSPKDDARNLTICAFMQ
jgi:hypothetical protein